MKPSGRTRQPGVGLFGRLCRRLVPAAILEAGGAPASLARTFGIALMIRLVLMPIACHGDLLSTYNRSYLLLQSFRPKALVPHELIQAAFLILYRPFLPLAEFFAWEGRTMVPFHFWIGEFVVHPAAMPAIFLFKLPYLLCDLSIALILLKLFENAPERALRAVSLWLLNPVTIFVFYVFGRHDVVSILFLALGLLALRGAHLLRGAVAIGVSIWSRYYGLFLLPFLVLTIRGGWKRKAAVVAGALAPIALYNVIVALLRDTPSSVAMSMAKAKFGAYLVGFSIDLGLKQEIFVFPALFGALFLYASVTPQRGDLVLRFCRLCVCCLSLFYATVYFHPQYFTWFILFLVVLRATDDAPVLRNLHRAQVLLFVPYTFYFGAPLFGLLFTPIDRNFFVGIPAPWDWIDTFGSTLLLLGLARTALAATCVFMVGWLLFGHRWQTVPHNSVPPRSSEAMAGSG